MPSAKFQEEHDFEKRQSEASRIRLKYPNRIPVRTLAGTSTRTYWWQAARLRVLLPATTPCHLFLTRFGMAVAAV